jgi:hypothetical protein
MRGRSSFARSAPAVTFSSAARRSGRLEPWFRACPDTGNFTTDTWEEGMQIMAPLAFSCHVKVFEYSADGKQSRLGRDGQTQSYDLKRSLQILKEAGYDGPLCIEAGASATESDSGRDAIRYVKELLTTL